MKKQKRQMLILLILLVVIAAGGFGAVKYVEHKEAQEAAEKAANTVYITNIAEEDLVHFTCVYFGEEREFRKIDGTWYAMEDPSAEIQQGWMQQMANAMAKIEAVEVLKGVVDLSQFGFDESYKQYYVYTDEKTYELVLGAFNDLTDCYYMYETSDPTTVYSFEPGFVTGFVSDVESLLVVEEEETDYSAYYSYYYGY